MRNILKSVSILLFSIIFLFSCKNNTSLREKKDLSGTDFIYVKGDHFELQNKKYFPLMLNYIVSFRNIKDEFVVSPFVDYEEIDVYETNTKKDIEEQLRGHFQLISEIGFNSIRLCFDRIGNENDRYYYSAEGKKYFVDTDYAKILAGLETIIDIANEKGIRVMLLLKAPFKKNLETFTIHLLEKFKDNPTIFSYDFMNEPLYFDEEQDRKKTDACKIVSQWRSLMDNHAPSQLFTVGFAEPIETFEWDPALLPVDFVAFHTYHPLRAKNEVYWYSTYVGKPWMVGETALPADNLRVSYKDQAMFLRDLYQYVLDCGGAGFGWWDFQEGVHGNFEAQFTGILNHDSITITKDGKHTIIGTLKPMVKEIEKFSTYTPKEKIRPINYFNIVGYNNYVIKGKVVNKKTKESIEGAVIRGWNESWTVGMNTFSNERGEFTLYSNDECTHFEISAPKMTKTRFNKDLKYKQIVSRTYDKNNLPNQMLEYQNISYRPFLKDSIYQSVFDFDESKFDKAKFVSEIETVYLSPIKKCR